MRTRLWTLPLLACVAGCPSYQPDPDVPEPLPPDTAVELVTELEVAPEVVYRHLRDDIRLDCRGIDELPGRINVSKLDPSWFGPPHRLRITRDRRGVIPQRQGRDCDLLRVEHATGEPVIVRLSKDGVQRLEVHEQAVGGSYATWPAISDNYDESRQACPSAQAQQVSWSQPIPVGRSLRIESVDGHDGCADLQIASATTALRWQLCIGKSRMPLAEGDVIDVSVAGAPGFETVKVERHGANPLRLWLGNGPVERTIPNAPQMRFARADSCRIERLACGMLRVPMHLEVAAAGRYLQLRSGEAATLNDSGASLEIHVGAADSVPIAGSGCEIEVGSHARFVAVERPRAEASASIAASE